jgi:hypothetical protein
MFLHDGLYVLNSTTVDLKMIDSVIKGQDMQNGHEPGSEL